MNETGRLLDGYLTEPELAAEFKKTRRAVQRWREEGIGPPYTRNGKTVIYNIESARTWLKSREIGAVRTRRVTRA